MIQVQKGDAQSLLARLAECRSDDDLEGAHWDADQALLAFIGDKDVTEAFGRIQKWYA